ncbi:LuxR family transcriptional regulator [Bartonella henselae]|uniref:Hydrolase, TatD family n=2 Tax=Bartonella TaxID=773 RepID=X5M4S5_BARHN|nr:TatD family hydrolase [Bartonella henselae]MDM9996749.1 TatD family hydrolase [Bartonella henselae]OLL49238.1 LuxR family transcriptional regulator [Bartonella henselae]OLL49402.1 LuxR family transcriptional regulator [Bartonella henselae]OLL50932.1 LuxR family transcriptional regulator [Bartonella henselae]OLL55191.1 LuxR family transcriptional regulator [Bartonella henselae]
MLIDTHCHLDFEDFSQDLDDVIQRALDANVKRMITISTHVRKLDKLLTITQAYPQVFCSVGTHPNHAHEEQNITAKELIDLSKHPKIVAFGEVGLDYHYDYSSPEEQKKVFQEHIIASQETQLPLVIHSRNADGDMEKILRKQIQENTFPFVMHCYSSGMQLARAGIELGGYISFSGILTFKNAFEIREIAKIVPHKYLLIETDAPFLAPVPHRGKTNEPSFVRYTAAVLAETIGLTIEEITQITTQNAFRLFSKMK